MQQLQINDDVAIQLHELAAHSRLSVSELVEQLVKSYKAEMEKRNELKQFFSQYKTDMSGFKFSREDANER